MADELWAMVVLVDEDAPPADAAPDDADASPYPAAGAGWGWVGLVASERGLRLLTLPSATRAAALRALRYDYPDAPLVELAPEATDVEAAGPAALLQAAAQQVRRYLAGSLQEFDVPLDLRGHTSFALSVWAVAAKIPYAQTRSYAWVARQLGGDSRGVYQAVGAALGSNPIPLIIPCHRVVGSDGSLHGYAGGLAMKARLLALETGQQRLLI
ncbi:MAG: Methylated-DNA--protein-cysteine methyltransferase [Chloroflexi bacterium ADurb.Bin325]|nr:MAG: Methylated-DNA--protein-cysteine methyltransferase [Chloroflexi bacterium ADurb.Bin325]